MTLPAVENDGGSVFPAVSIGNKRNKYQRMDSDAEDNHRSRSRKYVMACAFFASLNNVLLGYDVGVMSGAVLFIQQDLNITEVQTEVLIGSLSIISLFGSLAGGRTSDSIGRKWTMALAALVFQTGAAVMAVAPSFEVLMIGRTFAGIGIGLGVMIAPVYIAEISPTVARGFLTSFPEIFINLGILLGYVSNYAFSGLSVHISWRIMLAVGILPSVFIGFALCVIPESPRWLVLKGQVDKAREVLMKTNERDDEAEERLAEIQLAAAKTEGGEERPVWRELLSPSPAVRKMLIVGFGIQCFQQITGIDATVYYSPEILKEAGIQDETKLLAATVAVGITKTLFILIATFMIDSVGRKPLLYVSTVGMTLCLFSLSFTLTFLGQGTLGIALALLFVCGNVAFFSIGMGPVCWVLTSEIFPLRLRAQASAVGILPSVFIGFALCVIPESPRWLVLKGQVDKAREVLMKTNERDDEAEERLAEIQLAAAKTEGGEERPVWRELLSPSPAVRKMLIVGFGIQCFQQITGIDATVYYSPEILKEAGIQDETKLLAATVAVGITKTLFILIATFMIDSVGRKPLLYVSTVGMTLCLFSLSFTLTFLGQGTLGIALALLFVCGNVAFFSIGMGPVCWVLTSEIFPLRLRAQASALGAVGNRVCSGLVAMSFLSVSRAITVGGTFFVFSLVSALSVVFVYMLVPETSGKSLEQIELMFQGGMEMKGAEVELGDAERLVRKDQEF
ncbi:hypothetical protein F2Q69_00052575 [Brassica cretica]|uniref:Major facilitator superfamily (MFS) profile domain-containing protein n=1 Tax=Brassica cretica TaxID=69181 RepID=A0A8S9MZ81_BRACR|nr:hypothetical protein F2Q69_00052575 [Brassica cretica]